MGQVTEQADYKMFIPYVNREDLLAKAIDSAWDLRDDLMIVDNSPEGLETSEYHCWHGIYVMRPSVPLSCSQTFNLIMRMTKTAGRKICIWMHNDAEAGPGVCAELLERAREYVAEQRKWGILFTHYDTLSVINTDLLDVVGEWDTTLPQYFTDNDYYRRVRLAGWECIDTNLTDVKHVGSQTIHSDPQRKLLNDATFDLYRQYYMRKWGGEPGHETFTRAFDRKATVATKKFEIFT